MQESKYTNYREGMALPKVETNINTIVDTNCI